jgi:hypothetical protein
MFRFHLVRNLRTAVWLLLFALIPLAAGALYWANKTGLPEEWREAIENEISRRGVHVEIASLTYVPLRGFVAKNVRVFTEPERVHEISRFERVQLVLDNALLARGEFRLRKAELRNAHLSLPIDAENPSSGSLDFTGLYGTIILGVERTIQIRDARGEVGGIKLALTANLFDRVVSEQKEEDGKNEGWRREVIARIIEEMGHWDFGTGAPPTVQVDLGGNLSNRKSLRADFRISAPSVEKKQYRLTDVSAEGALNGYLLEISSFSAKDARGTVSGHADYQLYNRTGRFDVESSIDIPRLLESWLDTPLKGELLIGGGQRIQAAGDVDLSEASHPKVNLTGHAEFESVMFRGVSFDTLETWFSWQDGRLFLRDIKLVRPDGMAEGKLLMEGSKVRIALHTTLPVPLYEPFFIGQPLEHVIADFTENDNPFAEIFIEGAFNIRDRFDWAYTGHGRLKNLSYRGVPVVSGAAHFSVNHDELDFTDGSVTFDYKDYALRRAFSGPKRGSATVGRIRYDAATKTVGVEDVKGDIWAAPIVRFFAPQIADDLEQYRFHTPPTLSGSGVIDVTPQGRTDLTVKFSTPGKADYKFLGKIVTLLEPEATVNMRGAEVHISGLSAGAFDGTITGDLLHSGKSKLSGELTWSKLAMPGLSSTYGFKMKGGGLLTGRIDFSITGGDVKTMDGKGLIALEDAELFSVPIFGPLSGVVSTVLDDKRAGFERASHAFCTLNIREGMLSTRDFQSATPSVIFTGDGDVDLAARTIDFTTRLNARGLLGLITLPLRPFYGLFQFRGTGPIDKTVWENVHFTSPPAEQNDLLLASPPKARVVEE